MSGNKLIHFTNILNLPSIINDGLLRREGHNIEKFIEQIDSGIMLKNTIEARKIINKLAVIVKA